MMEQLQVKDLFQNLNEQQIQTKMRICRNLRNYIAHENAP